MTERKTLIIACGALAREFLAVKEANGWSHLDVTCLPAIWHNTPQKIPEGVRRKIRAARGIYDEILCLYGDCGTGGLLDRVLEEEGVERIDGDHCYAFFTGIDPSSFEMLGSVSLSPWSIIIVDTWMWTPYVMLICLAGLRSIPDYIYEAAEVDRASPLRQFWSITLPMALPFIMLAVLFRGIENFKMFDMVNLLTGGGPGSTTEVASITLKRQAFESWRTGYSSAFAIILFVAVFGLANIYVKVLNKVKSR